MPKWRRAKGIIQGLMCRAYTDQGFLKYLAGSKISRGPVGVKPQPDGVDDNGARYSGKNDESDHDTAPVTTTPPASGSKARLRPLCCILHATFRPFLWTAASSLWISPRFGLG
jgi:hypothetical protein